MDYLTGLLSGTRFSIITRSIYPNGLSDRPLIMYWVQYNILDLYILMILMDYLTGLLSGTGFSKITRSIYPNDPNGLPGRPLIRYWVQYNY